MQITIRRLAVSAALLLLASAISHTAQANYTITDLGSLGGGFSFGTGINASGQVTGYSSIAVDSLETRVFLYSSGLMTDVGTLSSATSVGIAINALGQITGASGSRAFLYSNGVMTDLGTLGGSISYGFAINDAGQITGYSRTIAGTDNTVNAQSERAFLYSNGVMTNLSPFGATRSYGLGINNFGQVTGYIDDGAAQQAFLYSDGVMTGIGTLGGYSRGQAINASGQITGHSSNDFYGGDPHAFLYSDGVMSDLGTLGGTNSFGTAINSSGQVVGYSFDEANEGYRAFLYSGGSMLDLNSLIDPLSPLAMYVMLDRADGINDSGYIVANGTDSRTGVPHAYLLSPSPVPLPAAAWLFLSGIGGLGALARRNRAT